MTIQKPTNRVLWYEGLGFGLLALLTWLDFFLPVPGMIFRPDAERERWQECLFISALVAVVGALVIWLTKRMVERLHRLEGLLRVCAWCGRIRENGQWMPIEEYFDQGFKIPTTHGVCPDCARNVVAECQHCAPSASAPPDTRAPDASPARFSGAADLRHPPRAVASPQPQD